MTDIGNNEIKGTDGNDHINPDGRGKINTGKGSDIVVISEGDFFEISGFEGTDLSTVSKDDIKRFNNLGEQLGREPRDIGQNDELLMFIDPEKEQTQSVQHFIRGGVTYVQIYDKELDQVVAAAKVIGTDFEIKVVGENGSLGVNSTEINDESIIDGLANGINEMISKGEIQKDSSLTATLRQYLEKNMDEAKDSWNPLDKLAAKFYENTTEEREK